MLTPGFPAFPPLALDLSNKITTKIISRPRQISGFNMFQKLWMRNKYK